MSEGVRTDAGANDDTELLLMQGAQTSPIQSESPSITLLNSMMGSGEAEEAQKLTHEPLESVIIENSMTPGHVFDTNTSQAETTTEDALYPKLDKGKGRQINVENKASVRDDPYLEGPPASEEPISRVISQSPVSTPPDLPPRRTDTAKTMSSQYTHRQFLNHDIPLEEISYLMKTIAFNGEKRAIVCQTSNGACPILSITNFLSLTSAIELPRSQQRISAVSLTDLLAEYLITHEKDLSVLGDLEGLHRGLNVDPQFNGVNRFLEGQRLMQTFGCELLHGWIPSPDSPASRYLKPSSQAFAADVDTQASVFPSFEAAQIEILTRPDSDAAIAMNAFFLEYSNNITPTGLSQLQEHLKEGEMSILFYNSHFSLLYRNPLVGELFTLVTDSGYLESGDDVVWESFVIDSATQFYSAEFIPRSILGEAMHQDDYGHSQREGGELADEDTKLARRLHQEEFGRHTDSDQALARRLQEEENSRQRQAEQRARARRLEEDQRRVEKYNGPVDSYAGSNAEIRPPQASRRASDQLVKPPPDNKKRDCLMM